LLGRNGTGLANGRTAGVVSVPGGKRILAVTSMAPISETDSRELEYEPIRPVRRVTDEIQTRGDPFEWLI